MHLIWFCQAVGLWWLRRLQEVANYAALEAGLWAQVAAPYQPPASLHNLVQSDPVHVKLWQSQRSQEWMHRASWGIWRPLASPQFTWHVSQLMIVWCTLNIGNYVHFVEPKLEESTRIPWHLQYFTIFPGYLHDIHRDSTTQPSPTISHLFFQRNWLCRCWPRRRLSKHPSAAGWMMVNDGEWWWMMVNDVRRKIWNILKRDETRMYSTWYNQL